MALTKKMEEYAAASREDVKQLLRDIAVIPAPSHHEEKRVGFVKAWMESKGAQGVYVDDALNVIWPMGVTEDNDVIAIMAHTDVVFADTEPLPFKEDGEYFYAPGIGDDTACLAVLLYAAKYFMENKLAPKTGLLIVANSCEEGLGNCKGSRKIVDDFKGRIKALITVDGDLKHLVTTAVGSHRYNVKITTEGGHSFGRFGNRNSIAYLASMISTLYDMKVPEKEGTKTTYNVGRIEGGTSVNTIAQEAQMLYEYRSDDKECLASMKNMFERVVEAYRAMGIGVEVTLLGERPCMGEVDPDRLEALRNHVRRCARETMDIELEDESGSTDANYPLSVGVPAVCMGGYYGQGAHTRGEKVEIASLDLGLRYVLDVMSEYFEAE